MKTKIVLIAILLFCSTVVSADDVTDIKKLYQSANREIRESKSQKVLVYLENIEKGIWKKVKDSDSQKKFNESLIKNEVFIHNKKIVKIAEMTTSGSGDWENTREFYFRKNGKVAFIFQKLITFQAYDTNQEKSFPKGPYVLEKRIYFNSKGEQIKLLLQAYVSSTKKEIPAKSVHQIDLDEYKTVQDFPFLKLLKSDVISNIKINNIS